MIDGWMDAQGEREARRQGVRGARREAGVESTSELRGRDHVTATRVMLPSTSMGIPTSGLYTTCVHKGSRPISRRKVRLCKQLSRGVSNTHRDF